MNLVAKLVVGVAACLLGLGACEDGGAGGADVADLRADAATALDADASSDCAGLGAAPCAAAPGCSALEGWPLEAGCLVWNDQAGAPNPSFVGCVAGPVTCNAMFQWVESSATPAQLWLLPSGCAPEGWHEVAAPSTCE